MIEINDHHFLCLYVPEKDALRGVFIAVVTAACVYVFMKFKSKGLMVVGISAFEMLPGYGRLSHVFLISSSCGVSGS